MIIKTTSADHEIFGEFCVMRTRILALRIFAVTLMACSLLSTFCFLAAETPEEAAKKGWAQMPHTWEAGVFSHGGYVQWLSLKKHPFLFVLSAASIIISAAILKYLEKRPE